VPTRLLIVTQAVDTEDPILGFFTGWIGEFAKHAERIEVICLKEGKHTLPANVRAHTLGKERGSPRLVRRAVYTLRFLVLIWKLRNDYDAVLVHMNQEYILIAGWFWKLLGMRVYLWRNHYAGSWLTDVASAFCTNVFCTSKYSYTAKYAKTVLMPVGVDTNVFAPKGERKSQSILFLARMAPSKRPHVFIEALGLLAKRGVLFTASLYGSPGKGDETYYEQLKHRIQELGLSSSVQFHPAIPQKETPAVYSAHDICVNTSPSGMYDKTIFESAACGCLSLTSNRNLTGLVDPQLLFAEGSAEDLAQRLEALLIKSVDEKEMLRSALRTLVIEKHSLALLANELERCMRPRRAVLFQNGSIGDFLMFVYLSELLMASRQFSAVTIVVPRNVVFLRGLIGAYPYLTVLEISSKKWGGLRSLLFGTKTVLVHPTIGRIPLRMKLLTWLVSRGQGSESIGFRDAGFLSSLYTKTLSYDINKPYIDTVRDLARAACGRIDVEPPRLHFNTSSGVLASYGLEGKEYVVFHPGASNPKRMFTVEDAVELVHFVLKKYPDMRVVLSGGPEETLFIEEIAQKSKDKNVVTATGVPAQDMMGLLQQARLFIGTDTGVTHLACFLGVQVIEIAHNATANWLAWYAQNATVLYRLAGEKDTHTSREYMEDHVKGVLRPFDTVPPEAVCQEIDLALT